jgi:hypothetical protein
MSSINQVHSLPAGPKHLIHNVPEICSGVTSSNINMWQNLSLNSTCVMQTVLCGTDGDLLQISMYCILVHTAYFLLYQQMIGLYGTD